ncbi:hypothetical protein [Tumebacillus flagellatus]|uniref:Uncharacterized protein n=1 Tax=Tumebacillus flagellatus TaxID=1157490 RepID=A0A074M481_9BACL|nr:hypothetical protein [Tumebacillus flagellatus]KEO80812.1 hypothetical protein EL26_24320 [Tumebacillus flagellatus]
MISLEDVQNVCDSCGGEEDVSNIACGENPAGTHVFLTKCSIDLCKTCRANLFVQIVRWDAAEHGQAYTYELIDKAKKATEEEGEEIV